MTRILVILVGAGFLAISAVVRNASPVRALPDVEAELAYFPSGDLLRVASLGFDGLAADAAFLRAVQYYGEHRRTDRKYPFTKHLFDVTTELDPYFVTPYLFGSLILADDTRRLDHAIELLQRGMEYHPDSWELPFEAGFLIIVHTRRHDLAAPYFERAIANPEAPLYVRRFAAFSYNETGSKRQSLALWREIEREADTETLREAARRYIEELEKELAP